MMDLIIVRMRSSKWWIWLLSGRSSRCTEFCISHKLWSSYWVEVLRPTRQNTSFQRRSS